MVKVMSRGQIGARKRRILFVYNEAKRVTDKRVEQAVNEKGKCELEDILIDKNRFFNRLMREIGVRKATLEDYFEVWKTEGSFMEFKFGRFQGTFCLSKVYHNLPESEQNKID